MSAALCPADGLGLWRTEVGDSVGIFQRKVMWSIGLYVQDELNFPPQGPPKKLFDTRKFWRGPNFIHTCADPFLHVYEDELFIFYEAAKAAKPAWIEGYRTANLINFTSLGEILREKHHLSYPSIVPFGADIYMIPELVAANEVALYKFGNFPYGLTKIRILLSGNYVDPSIVKVGNTWFLFVTLNGCLHLFFADDLLSGDFVPHCANPISSDPTISRCGGMPVILGGKLHRLAQNCNGRYGSNLSLVEILDLTKTTYVERVAKQDIFSEKQGWNDAGNHHLSVARFRGRYVLAVDGQDYDYYLHKLVGRLYRPFV